MTNLNQSEQETLQSKTFHWDEAFAPPAFHALHAAHDWAWCSLIISAPFRKAGSLVSSSFLSSHNSWLELVQSSPNMFHAVYHAGIESHHYHHHGATLERTTMTTGKQRIFCSALCLDEEIKVSLKVRIQWLQFERKVICEVSQVRFLLHCCRPSAKPEHIFWFSVNLKLNRRHCPAVVSIKAIWLRVPSGEIRDVQWSTAVSRVSDVVWKRRKWSVSFAR